VRFGPEGQDCGRSGIQHFVNNYTQRPEKLLGPAEAVGASIATGWEQSSLCR
jgi:hypothetical protein